jgi:hypothetical protein
VLKSFLPDTIIQAIERVLGGEIYVPPQIAYAASPVRSDAGTASRDPSGEATINRWMRGASRASSTCCSICGRAIDQGNRRRRRSRRRHGESASAAIYRVLNARRRTEAVALAARLEASR